MQARRYAPGVTIIANGNLHHDGHANEALQFGADLVTLGKGVLANPDFPLRLSAGAKLREFDGSILSPIANIKTSELSF